MIVEHQENEEKLLPTILEIPTKEAPYDPTKDSMLVKAASKLYGLEAGLEKLKNLDDWYRFHKKHVIFNFLIKSYNFSKIF